jgi:hypothetical protein
VPGPGEDDAFISREEPIARDSASLIQAASAEIRRLREQRNWESDRAWLVIWQGIASSPASQARTNADRRFVWLMPENGKLRPTQHRPSQIGPGCNLLRSQPVLGKRRFSGKSWHGIPGVGFFEPFERAQGPQKSVEVLFRNPLQLASDDFARAHAYIVLMPIYSEHSVAAGATALCQVMIEPEPVNSIVKHDSGRPSDGAIR